MLPESIRKGKARSRAWVPVTRGLYRLVDLSEPWLVDVQAWTEVLRPDGAFTHLTGAALRGWPLPQVTPPVFGVIPSDAARPRRAGLIVSRQTGPLVTEARNGFTLATATDTLLAAARDLALLDLVVLVDGALYRQDCTLGELRLAVQHRRRGAPALRRALRYADGRSESAWETVLRMLHHLCDVPVEPQYPIGSYRADLRIGRTNRLAEYDGDEHRKPERHAHDLERERYFGRQRMQRFGYSSRVLLHQGLSVLRDADEALGRPHQPARIRAWHAALAASSYTSSGRARLQARWAFRGGRRTSDRTRHRPAF